MSENSPHVCSEKSVSDQEVARTHNRWYKVQTPRFSHHDCGSLNKNCGSKVPYKDSIALGFNMKKH
jgi:hypothetical protein